MTTAPAQRDLDLVLMGATGYVGRQTAAQLAERAPAGTRIAVAGRNLPKLEAVRAGLGDRAAQWPLIQVDSSDAPGLAALADSTRAVVSTVGPYLRYGMPLVAACAQAGTSYVDLTGEVLFVRATIDKYHETAVSTGARIVHSCGFDSIPSDLGVHVLARTAGQLTDTTTVVRRAEGGISGGTIDSKRAELEAMRADPGARKVAQDPYALSPQRDSEPDFGAQGEPVRPIHEPGLGWLAPFIMAGYNTRIVRRSNALGGWNYGRGFRYREFYGYGEGPVNLARATAMAAGVAGFDAGMAFGPTRGALSRFLPKPGEGPDEAKLDRGGMLFEIHGSAVDGTSWVATVAAEGDPGYGATAIWLAESALSAALDGPAGLLPSGGGVLTPATAFGDVLVERLRASGMTLEAKQSDG